MQRTIVTRLPGRRDQLEESREVIEFDLKQLTIDLANATDSQLLEGTLANHPADEASDLIVAEIDLSRIRELQVEIRDVDEALERIERGVYGACVECGDEIDPARLNILPLAQRCPSCQTRYDATPAQWSTVHVLAVSDADGLGHRRPGTECGDA